MPRHKCDGRQIIKKFVGDSPTRIDACNLECRMKMLLESYYHLTDARRMVNGWGKWMTDTAGYYYVIQRERKRSEQYNHICLITFRHVPTHVQRDSIVCAYGQDNFAAGRHSTHVNYANNRSRTSKPKVISRK